MCDSTSSCFDHPEAAGTDDDPIRFSITIDSRKMAAHLHLLPSEDGPPMTIESIIELAEQLGISDRIDLAAVEAALALDRAASVLVCAGIEPVHGADGKLLSLVPSIRERCPRLTENGLTDYRDLGEIVIVHPGDALLRRIDPTPGVPGVNLFGEVIPAEPGKAVMFAADLSGTLISPEDPDLLIAAICGQPIQVNNGIEVEPVYSVEQANLESGNINFEGTVNVRGDVQAGMSIRAKGDIHVEGTIESALLDAGGDIVVKGGIVGGNESVTGFHPEIRCRGSLHARFVQNSRIIAESGIFIEEAAMQSELTAGHQIIVGRDGCAKGHLIGGYARATMLIKAQVIGAASSQKTILVAGADKELEQRLAMAGKIRFAWENKLNDIDKLIALAKESRGRISAATLAAAQKTRTAVRNELDSLREKERELQRQFDLAMQASVVAKKSLNGGVEIRFGTKRYSLHDEREGGVFQIDADRLILR